MKLAERSNNDILPGLIDTELTQGISNVASSQAINEVYKMAISTSAIAKVIAYAISQPADVDSREQSTDSKRLGF